MRTVELKQSKIINGQSFFEGQTVEVEDNVAERWIWAGEAQAIEAATAIAATSEAQTTDTATKPRQKKQ